MRGQGTPCLFFIGLLSLAGLQRRDDHRREYFGRNSFLLKTTCQNFLVEREEKGRNERPRDLKVL